MEDYILQMKNITKLFSGVRALSNVSFNVKRGEIHALCGENGAGKSTLMKVLSGVYPKGEYSGEIWVDGKLQQYTRIKDSERAGIAIIYQELGLVNTMTVCENIFLGNEIIKNGHIDWDTQNNRSLELLKRVKLTENPATPVEQLGTGKQQLIEIAKAINKDVKILILDEPTSSLTEEDSENLLNLLREFKQAGMTCIYISHKLNEVLSIADTVTVLRDGETIVTKAADTLSESDLISYMVGRNMDDTYPHMSHTPGDIALEIRNWTVPTKKDASRFLLRDVSFHVREGEIVGIAGLMGAGRTEMAMSVYGALSEQPVSGELYLNGKRRKRFKAPKEAIDAGVVYLSEDRKRYGLILGSDLKTNITLSCLDKLTKRGILDLDEETRQVAQSIQDLNVKTPSMLQLAKNLSGGNQQKVVIAKALMTQPRVLILDEPTRGIDVGAKYEIYQLMDRLVKDGYSVVMISSELPEIIHMSDRIYVMSEGKMQAELDNAKKNITQKEILYYAAGGQ